MKPTDLDLDFCVNPTPRVRLIRAAANLFSAKAPEAVGIREIAAAAGTTSGMIGFYFGSKEGLRQMAVHQACRWGQWLVKSLPAPPSTTCPGTPAQASASIRAWIHAMASLAWPWRERPSPRRAWLALLLREMMEPRPGTEAMVFDLVQGHREYMAQWIRVLRPDLDLEAAQRMSLSIQGQVLFFLTYRSLVWEHGLPQGESGLDPMVDHVLRFSLLGLGVVA